MKKLMQCLTVVMLLSAFAPAQLKAEKILSTSINSEEPSRNASEKVVLTRLKAIRELTKTHLSQSEKRALREEVLAMKARRDGNGPVIYISAGGLLLIIILLIILL